MANNANEKTRANSVMVTAHDPAARRLEWRFPNQTPAIMPVLFVYRERFDGETDCDYRAMIHGYGQKIGDGGAKGQGASAAVRAEAMRRIAGNCTAGFWEFDPVRELAKAVCMAKGKKDEGAVYAWLKKQAEHIRTALQNEPAVAEALELIRGPRIVVDISDVLAELDAMPGDEADEADDETETDPAQGETK